MAKFFSKNSKNAKTEFRNFDGRKSDFRGFFELRPQNMTILFPIWWIDQPRNRPSNGRKMRLKFQIFSFLVWLWKKLRNFKILTPLLIYNVVMRKIFAFVNHTHIQSPSLFKIHFISEFWNSANFFYSYTKNHVFSGGIRFLRPRLIKFEICPSFMHIMP